MSLGVPPHTKPAIPPDRTPQQLRNHFEVEREIAARLRASDRNERMKLYATMYDELFARVPDHPRLTRRVDEARTAGLNRVKMRLLRRFLRPDGRVVEFGCGDCRFAYELCHHVRKVYGVDISDQRRRRDPLPPNFELIVYDGYHLPLEPDSVDVVFSDQLIEHFHPEDTRHHFDTARRVLRPGGVYVFRTPNALSGPHDISMYFRDKPEGFHLKEWTYKELVCLLRDIGYRGIVSYHFLKGRPIRVPMAASILAERWIASLPEPFQRSIVTRLFREICVAARK